MALQFRFGDMEKICKKLCMNKDKGKILWKGVGSDGQYRQTTIHSHGDGGQVSNSTAKQMAIQLKFKDVDDMFNFLNDRKRKF